MKHFTRQGMCLVGEYRGVHAGWIPPDWCRSMIKSNPGFRDALTIALKTKTPKPWKKQ